MSDFLAEAFKELKLEELNEADFELTKDGLEKLDKFYDDDEASDEVVVYDDDLNNFDDEEEKVDYVGKKILDCNTCHSLTFVSDEDITIDEQTGEVNPEMECPYCHSYDGFTLVGKVCPVEEEKTEEEVEEKEEIDESCKSKKTKNEHNLSESLIKRFKSVSEVPDEEVNNKNFIEELEKILGPDELYGRSISEIKDFDIIQTISVFDDGVDSHLGCRFKALVSGDFSDDEHATLEWIDFDFSDKNNMFVQAWYEKDGDDFVSTSDYGTIWMKDISSKIIDAFANNVEYGISDVFETAEQALYDYVPVPSDGEVEESMRTVKKSKKTKNELFDANLDLSNFGGQGNDVSVLSPGGGLSKMLPVGEELDDEEDRREQRRKDRRKARRDVRRAKRTNEPVDESVKKKMNESNKDNVIWSSTAYRDWVFDASDEELRDTLIDIKGLDDEEIDNMSRESMEDTLLDVGADQDYEVLVEGVLPEIEKQCKDSYLYLTGDYQRWNGPRSVAKVIKAEDLTKLLYPNYDAETEIRSDNGNLYYTEYSHDAPMGGTSIYLYSVKDNNAKEKLDDYIDNEDFFGNNEDLSFEDIKTLIENKVLTPVKNVFNESFTRRKKRKNIKESKSKSVKNEDHQADNVLTKYQRWVDYDMKKYGKISKVTQKALDKAGFEVVKDDHGDYEVIANTNESLSEARKSLEDRVYSVIDEVIRDNKLGNIYDIIDALEGEVPEYYGTYCNTDLNEIPIYKAFIQNLTKYLIKHMNKEDVGGYNESFGKMKHKKIIEAKNDASQKLLLKQKIANEIKVMIQDSDLYNLDNILEDEIPGYYVDIDDDIIDIYDDFAFALAAYMMENYDKARIENESLSEDFKDVTITTDDTHMEMTSDENGKVTVTTEPVCKECEDKEEVIEPLTDEDEVEIEKKSFDNENDDEVEVDFDEFDEETFESLTESFLKKTYNNVKSFKVNEEKDNGVSATKDGKIIVEGKITFNSGAQKDTKFIFEGHQATKRGKVKLIGENAQITNGKKAFTITGSIDNKKLVVESLNYNYRQKNPITHKADRIYGTVKKG